MADDCASFGVRRGSSDFDQNDGCREQRNRHSRVHGDAERAMVGITRQRMSVRHLPHSQKRQQDQAYESGSAKSAWLPAADPRAQRLHAGEGRGAVGPGRKVSEARRAFGKGGQHPVAMADGLVAGQAQAAKDVLCRANDAFFDQGNSEEACLHSSLAAPYRASGTNPEQRWACFVADNFINCENEAVFQ